MILFKANTSKNNFYDKSLNLSELANKFETDKGTADSKSLSWSKDFPIHTCMSYTIVYEKYIKHRRNDHVSMMEIGVCDKRFPYASIKMWMSYFEHVSFYAFDNFWGQSFDDKLNDIKSLNEHGVNFIYGDQGNWNDWNELASIFSNKFDFLIEDGSHWPNHMMISLWKSIPIIKPGGYFFMEDIQNPLKSRGWFRYDNSLIAEELLQTSITKKLNSSFLNDQQNKDIENNFELVDLVLDPNQINYLGVFKKK